ncbi:disease resistance At4g27190-like [Olea europaea subsp. europaea]|uniref:Disease resistance At4g27190-like n=1 Tax=Olea europaea subsp. europaea TaxID=158383 RepID=A0A8S0QDL7_OLEEU|nr:disease resistance At4g27190-like [Olea europaea subsp. europaea]
MTNIQGAHKLVYSRIEFRYSYIESDEAKSLLLLCSLYPEDSSVYFEDLVRYAWGLELFRDTKMLIATIDKENSIVDVLKSFYLLLPDENKDWEKLHDVIRDVCLQIASKDKHVHMSKHTRWMESPKHDNDESYSAISLTSVEMNQLPNRLKHSSSYCPLFPGILLQLKKLEELYLGFIEIRDDELEQ